MENVTKGKIYFDLEEHGGESVYVRCVVDTVSSAGIAAVIKSLVADYCKTSQMDAKVNGVEYTVDDMLEELAMIIGDGVKKWENNTIKYQRMEIAKIEVVNENN